jgi:hypothetical protein
MVYQLVECLLISIEWDPAQRSNSSNKVLAHWWSTFTCFLKAVKFEQSTLPHDTEPSPYPIDQLKTQARDCLVKACCHAHRYRLHNMLVAQSPLKDGHRLLHSTKLINDHLVLGWEKLEAKIAE